MASERGELLRTQAVQAIIAALGGCEVRIYGDDRLSQDAGTHLRLSDETSSVITSDTYWSETPKVTRGPQRRVHRQIVVTVQVKETEL